MSQNNTNRDIRRFETDADGNTTRVLLNTDEPLGLLDGDYQEQLEELQNRLNAITGGAYSNTVQIGHGGTGAESAKAAMTNLVTALDSISQSDNNSYTFVAQRTGGTGSGSVYALAQGAVAEQIGALKASNNLSDLNNAVGALANLLQNINDVVVPPGVPATAIIDSLKVLLSIYGTGVTPLKISMKDLVDDYLSEYFLKKSNNLSDLQSLVTALVNIFDGVNNISGQLTGYSNILITNGTPSTPTAGKATINDLFDVLSAKINTEYGMSKNVATGLYDFTGNAAFAVNAAHTFNITTGDPTSSLGTRSFNCKRKTFSGLTGTATVAFDPLVTTSKVLNYNILSVSVIEVSTGTTAIVKGFSVACESVPSDGDYEYTVSAEIEAQGTGIDVTLEILYSYEVAV
jgi:hypothetical protein